MNIKVYGTKACGKCKATKSKLEEMHVPFEYIDDDEVTLAYAQKKGIMQVPIIDIDGKVYSEVPEGIILDNMS